MINPSKYPQLRPPGDENDDPPGRNFRTVWEPQPNWPVTDWLGIVHKASTPQGRQVSTPGLEIVKYFHNSDNLGTNTVIPRVETIPNGVKTPVRLADR